MARRCNARSDRGSSHPIGCAALRVDRRLPRQRSRPHPLMRKLEAIREAGAIVQNIVLAPLSRENLAQLIADSVHCEPERVAPLAELVHQKTAGNPFFAIQFISALAEEGLGF